MHCPRTSSCRFNVFCMQLKNRPIFCHYFQITKVRRYFMIFIRYLHVLFIGSLLWSVLRLAAALLEVHNKSNPESPARGLTVIAASMLGFANFRKFKSPVTLREVRWLLKVIYTNSLITVEDKPRVDAMLSTSSVRPDVSIEHRLLTARQRAYTALYIYVA